MHVHWIGGVSGVHLVLVALSIFVCGSNRGRLNAQYIISI
jgi:hypothetical protein